MNVSVTHEGEGYGWALDWTGEKEVDLDFLRPWVLPPAERCDIRAT